jgi:hypothetical protein
LSSLNAGSAKRTCVSFVHVPLIHVQFSRPAIGLALAVGHATLVYTRLDPLDKKAESGTQ